LPNSSEWQKVNITNNDFYFSDRSKDFAIVPVHPLVNSQHRSFIIVQDDYKAKSGCNKVGFLDIFEFERRPITALQKMFSQAL
jgi:hypothetical protein